MARRMSGSSARRTRSVRDDRFRRRRKPNHDQLSYGRASACSRPCTIPASATRTGVQSIAGPCKISGAVGVAGLSRCGQNIDRQARRRPVIGKDRGQDWFAERLLSDCTSSTAVSREILPVRCLCLHQYCERNDVALPGDRYSIGAQTT